MTIKLVHADSLYTDAPYAYASIAPRGSLIFTAGACPLDDKGEAVGVGDARAQASLAVANLATALAESGGTLADVLKTTVFAASAERADLVAAWDVVRAPSVITTRPARCSASPCSAGPISSSRSKPSRWPCRKRSPARPRAHRAKAQPSQ